MIEHIPQTVEKAFLYFHSARTTSEQLRPFLPMLIENLPHTYIWAGDGVISGSPVMRQQLCYGDDPQRFWFTFPMQDACSTESFRNHVEAMGATLSCGGAYVNMLVDTMMARFGLSAAKVVLGGFQHGSCIALAAAMIRKKDPFAYTILLEPFILESYYLNEESSLPQTTVVCIDNLHIRNRTNEWLDIGTDQEFQRFGMNTMRITVEDGDDHLDSRMMEEAIKILKKL